MTRDRKDNDLTAEEWDWFTRELEPGLSAAESEFIEISAADVIRRNKCQKDQLPAPESKL